MEYAEFYAKVRLSDNAVIAHIGQHCARRGYRVDRLLPITVERFGKSFWKYLVPLIRVVA